MESTIFRHIAFLLILFGAMNRADGRAVRLWSYEELIQTSDLVAIVEPLSSEDTKDVYAGTPYGRPLDHFLGHNTKFKVHAVLKGIHSPDKPLIVLHFSYSKEVTFVANGARFIRFISGPLQFKKQVLKDEKEVGGVTVYAEEPVWLAFLKKKADGRYEPVTDPYDSMDSFRELHQASFFTPPN